AVWLVRESAAPGVLAARTAGGPALFIALALLCALPLLALLGRPERAPRRRTRALLVVLSFATAAGPALGPLPWRPPGPGARRAGVDARALGGALCAGGGGDDARAGQPRRPSSVDRRGVDRRVALHLAALDGAPERAAAAGGRGAGEAGRAAGPVPGLPPAPV